MPSQVYETVNKAWNSTCRVVFGQEIAPLSECAEWLREYDLELRTEKSAVSGKPITLSLEDYSRNARFVAFDEINLGKKFEPLSINDIKDFDSIIESVQERALYAGSIVLGHSNSVQNSNNVIDSHFILESTVVAESKYIAYSRYVAYGEYCFGLFGADKDIHAIKCHGSELKRCFECHMVELLSDCYYCAKTQNCHDCMFCFGMENSSYAIGNTTLEKEKYAAIKSKLLLEMIGEIKKEKRIFSLLKLIEKSADYPTDSRLRFEKEKLLPFDAAPIEKAFAKACSLVLGRNIGNMDSYTAFLWKHVPRNVAVRSPLSGQETNVCGHRAHLLDLFNIRKRLVTEEEMRSIGRNSGLARLEGLSMDLGTLVESLHPIAYTNLDKVAGQTENFHDVPVIIDCADCCHGCAFVRSKKCAYSHWPSGSEAIFGSSAVFDSSFCINNYYSKRMSRAFECDNCESCADAYFLHNCENVRDSMFCFNVKNLRHAIGNAEMPQEKYKSVKLAIVDQIADELEKKKDLKWDIYNLAEQR